MKYRKLICLSILVLMFIISVRLMYKVNSPEKSALNASTKENNEISDEIILMTEWGYTYGGLTEECSLSAPLIQTKDMGFIIAGHTDSYGAGSADMWLVKTDENGIIQWNQTYGDLEIDIAFSVLEATDGGFLLVGGTLSYGSGVFDIYTVKTFANGTLEWNQTYGGSENEMAYSVIQTLDGGFLMAGFSSSYGEGYEDAWLIKTFDNGTLEWNQTYGGGDYEIFYSVIESSDGFYCVGATSSYGVGSEDMWLVKTFKNGTTKWNQTYGGGSRDIAYDLDQFSNGDLILVGYSSSFEIGNCAYMVKAYPNGTKIWDQFFSNGQTCYSGVITNEGYFLAVGSAQPSSIDMFLLKIFTNGTIIWDETFDNGVMEEAWSVVETDLGEYVIAGYTSVNEDISDLWLVKVFENVSSQSSEISSMQTHDQSSTMVEYDSSNETSDYSDTSQIVGQSSSEISISNSTETSSTSASIYSQESSKSSDISELLLNNVTSGLGIPLLLLGVVSVIIIKSQWVNNS